MPSNRTNAQASPGRREHAEPPLPNQRFLHRDAGRAVAGSTPRGAVFTPGVYQINGTINVTNPDTVVLGLGLATWCPNSSSASRRRRRHPHRRPALRRPHRQQLRPGPDRPVRVKHDHAADPTVLSDVFARIGGATAGKATQTLQVNSANVVGDRAPVAARAATASASAGRPTPPPTAMLVVNGANVTMYAVEHYQAVQVQWNGNGGADYFYQSEMPYDPPPASAGWTDPPTAIPPSTSPAR